MSIVLRFLTLVKYGFPPDTPPSGEQLPEHTPLYPDHLQEGDRKEHNTSSRLSIFQSACCSLCLSRPLSVLDDITLSLSLSSSPSITICVDSVKAAT